ncbi:MAG: ABC transporter ATP-binding protein [Weeksellaceae bacterium]
MIQVKNLTVALGGKTIIDNLSFSLDKGKKMAIIGGSGTGKTTLLNTMAGFIPNFKGTILIDNIALNPTNIATIRSQIAWLPQDTSLNVKTVEELFYAPFNLQANKKQKPSKQEILEIFDAFELSESLLLKDSRDISGGQKQRIILASCILLHKPLLLIDEPTSALDKTIKEKVTDYVLGIKELTILAVTHDKYWMDQSDDILSL